MTKTVSISGEWGKKGEDYVAGDTLTIKDGGTQREGNFADEHGNKKMETIFAIETKNGEKMVRMNQTSINILIDSFGDESNDWVGKEVLVRMKKDTVAGKKVDIYYFVTPEWDFDDYGELVKGGASGPAEVAEELNPDDIGF